MLNLDLLMPLNNNKDKDKTLKATYKAQRLPRNVQK